MNLLLAVLLAAHLPAYFSPDRVGTRRAPTLPSLSVADAGPTGTAAESGPPRTGWRSSPDATLAQCACGCGAAAVPLAAGFALGFGSFLYENYDEARLAVAATGIVVPAAAASGVALAGHGRGRAGRAYLYSYAAALVLGGLGFVAGPRLAMDRFSGAYIGWAVGSAFGSLAGYNLREIP